MKNQKNSINNSAIEFIIVFALVALMAAIFGYKDQSSILFISANTNYVITIFAILGGALAWGIYLWLWIAKGLFGGTNEDKLAKVKLSYYGYLVAAFVIIFLQVLQITMVDAEWQLMDFVFPLSLFTCHIFCKTWLNGVGKNG